MAYGPNHLFSSYSLLGLAVTEPFRAKTVVQNTNLGIILVNRTKVRRTCPDHSRCLGDRPEIVPHTDL